MKKILILCILTFGMMSVYTAQSKLEYTKFEVSEAINDLQDFSEWTMQDIEFGKMDEEIGNLYIENYQQTIDRLMEVYNYLKEIERTNIHLTENK